jgi:hypothetical protein
MSAVGFCGKYGDAEKADVATDITRRLTNGLRTRWSKTDDFMHGYRSRRILEAGLLQGSRPIF